MAQGKAVLSNAELLAILIGSGTPHESAVALSQRILSSVSNSLTALGKQTLQQLQAFKGIGQAKAITILAATQKYHALIRTTIAVLLPPKPEAVLRK